METREWYSSETGCANQALIIDEKTGRSVAVAYDAEDAPLLAAAPRLMRFAEAMENVMVGIPQNLLVTTSQTDRSDFIAKVIQAWNDDYSLTADIRGDTPIGG